MESPSPSPLTPNEFSAAVSAITNSFGDPTRRAIYLHAHTQRDDGVTAAQVADTFGLHPNVARHHLDKLAAGGHLDVTTARPGFPAGAGRPSKRYRAAATQVTLDIPVKADDLVLTLLGRALSRLPQHEAEAMAEEVGEEFGQTIARAMGSDASSGHRSLRSALHVVADALTAHGFAAHTEKRGNELRIVNNHCPFGEVAIDHPVICAVDRGMVKGMLRSLYGEADPLHTSSLPQGDTVCVTAV